MNSTNRVDLLSILGDRAPKLLIVDVGALYLAGQHLAHTSLLADNGTTMVGFEPSQAECDTLARVFGPKHKFLPYAVGDGSTAPFYRCNYPMTSSLFKPDLDVMGWYQNLPEFCQVVEVSELTTVRLDDVPEAQGVDYIKLDVQGYERQVLAGAAACLESALVVHTEVEFVQIYQGQPLFADIDLTLRSHGFMFHRFVNLEGRTLRDCGFVDSETTRSQQLWADAVYIRNPANWSALSSEQLLKLAVILHQMYGSADFCGLLLATYDSREDAAFRERYTEAFAV